jgi:arginyl-tRNA synthetase
MSYDPVQILSERFAAAIASAFPWAAGDPQIAASRNPKFGDFQCNAAMTLAKTVGKPPREVAKAIIEKVDVSGIAEPLTEASIAGPGFINIVLKADALPSLLRALDTPALGIEPVGEVSQGTRVGRPVPQHTVDEGDKGTRVGRPVPRHAVGEGDQGTRVGRPVPQHTIVVDLCGVNLAKQMHVGHLRATIIGDALARVFTRLGYNVIRQNHVGDWGLPIAMVTERLMQLAARGEDIRRLDLDALERLYKDAKVEADADEKGLAAVRRWNLGPKAAAELEEQVAGAGEAMARAKRTLIKLQTHDPETVAFWQRIVDVTMTECVRTCERLNAIVRREDTAGESSYADELAGIVADVEKRGVAEESEGALVIRVPGFEEPCLIRKSDGAFLYATTDLAGIRRRVQKFGADRVVYAVDARQALHFKLVFAAAAKAGYTMRPPPPGTSGPASLEHAAFGMVLGEDGKPFKTRSGENVKLSSLIDEAVERALVVVRQKIAEARALAAQHGKPYQEPSEAEKRDIADAVGVAAIKYADLSNDRIKDYVFSFDRMLAFEGNTGPYLLYALVRVRKIFAEAAERGVRVDAAAPIVIAAAHEKALALTLLRYPGVVRGVASALEPHRLCGYLYELAQAFSSFYNECHVLNAPDEATRQSRLHLCRVVERVMADGLGVLGVRTLERM